jgi:hypothetical protein
MRTIAMPLSGRKEKRIQMAIPARLQGPHASPSFEHAVTEDVSPHGARVLTQQPWHVGAFLRIAFADYERPQPARVVYCQPHLRRGFCVGLQLNESTVP